MSGIDKEKLIIFRKIMNVDYEIRFINCSCSYYIVPYSYLRAGLGFGSEVEVHLKCELSSVPVHLPKK